MILCAGEALIDMLPRQTTGGEAAFAPYPGGSVFNTAIALGRLGTRTGFFSGLSNDLFGQRLTAALSESNVDSSLVAYSDRPTTLAFVTLTDGQAEYAFYDENTAGRMIGSNDLPEIPDDVTALFFGGISLAVEPCASVYETLYMWEAEEERAIVLDANVRPDFIPDEGIYRTRMKRLMAAADIVKVSEEDLKWLGGDTPVDDQIQTLLAGRPAMVCLTQGAGGATVYRESGAIHQPAEKVDVVDTVGAGDTFNAGFLSVLRKHNKLRRQWLSFTTDDIVAEALQLATRAAAVTVSRAGANPPWSWDLE
ncbi:carbohydrate kinase family protein [Pseudaestuariivita rosea]|uniref:carbohydrate kinase family protein n=1 Tax=Pseudaestuariivita rosea TaxID=2763263 RepID=UPI001ABB72D6